MLWPIFKKTGALNASSFDHDLYFPLEDEITAILEARSKVPYTNAVKDKVVLACLGIATSTSGWPSYGTRLIMKVVERCHKSTPQKLSES